jgi:hypothetical protein
MKVPKFVISTVATITAVGAIGFAYAQTYTGDSGKPETVNQLPKPSGSTDPSGGTTSGSSSSAIDTKTSDSASANTSGDSSNMADERLARVDRN